MNVLLVDTETSGVDSEKDCVIEVAATIYDLDLATPIESYASLIRADGNAAEPINRIPVAALAKAPADVEVWRRVSSMLADAKAILAHRAEFDRSFFPPTLAASRPWVCTHEDWPWPNGSGTLVHVALAHGLGVATAHRAAADVDLMARLLTRCAEMGHDLGAMLARAMRPKVLVRGLQRFEDNHMAKAAGFRWDGERKWWVRRMVLDDIAALPFPCSIVEEAAA